MEIYRPSLLPVQTIPIRLDHSHHDNRLSFNQQNILRSKTISLIIKLHLLNSRAKASETSILIHAGSNQAPWYHGIYPDGIHVLLSW